MRNLEGSGWMTNPEPSVIEAKAQDKEAKGPIVDAKALPYVFTLKVKLPVPGDASEAVPGAAAPAHGAPPAPGAAAAPAPAAATALATPPAAAPATPATTPAQQGPAS